MKPIEVRIDPKEFHELVPGTHDVFAKQKCREAGIPVRGMFTLTFDGVTHGHLVLDRDPRTGEYVYRWAEEGVADEGC